MLPTQYSEPWAAGPDDQTGPDDDANTCWKCGEEMDKFETRGDDGGHYGDCRPAIEVYGTPEHEAWLIEMERREG